MSRLVLARSPLMFGRSSLRNNLVGLWTLNESGTGIRYDRVRSSHLTNTNAVSQTTGPMPGSNASQFVAASSQYLSVADNADLRAQGALELSAWVYLDSLPASGFAMFIAGKWTSAGSREYVLILLNTAGVYRFQFFVRDLADTTSSTVVATTFGTPSTGTWYLVTGFYTGTQIGVSVNTISDLAACTSGIRVSTNPFTVGAYTNPTQYMDGRVAQVALWQGRTLATSERKLLYNNGNGLRWPW